MTTTTDGRNQDLAELDDEIDWLDEEEVRLWHRLKSLQQERLDLEMVRDELELERGW